MLKKLKLKFVLVNMLLVGTVLGLLFGAVYGLTYREQSRRLEASLDRMLHGAEQPGLLPPLQTEPDGYALGTYGFTVWSDPKGNYTLIKHYGATLKEEDLEDALDHVLDREETMGRYGANVIYKTRPMAGGLLVAFASTEDMDRSLAATRAVTATVCLASLGVFVAISFFLAQLAMRPLEKSWSQQKQFIADASHDLKTPLTVMLANDRILASHPESTVASLQQWVDSNLQEGERMKGLIDRLLELARAEDGRQPLPLAPVDLSRLCQRIALQFEPVAFEKALSLRTMIQPEVTWIANEEALTRILHVLLDNALKYSPAGQEVLLELSGRGSQARLQITNQATPLDKTAREQIFQRFYRADAARREGGHGLGLCIARNLAETMGLRLSLVRSDQSGTTFELRKKR